MKIISNKSYCRQYINDKVLNQTGKYQKLKSNRKISETYLLPEDAADVNIIALKKKKGR
jgi:hypothetical protein